MGLPLDGITVVALEQAVAAPFCTRQLADMGARVIKIERPDGGDFARAYDSVVHGYSANFFWLNRTKESLVLDLKQPQGLAVLQRLLATADVFVQNLGPGVAARLGLESGALAQRFPRLVICSVSGYGEGGPYRERKAYDLLVQAESGVTAITGTPADGAKVGISIADIAAGMYAFSGVVLALFARERTGQGRIVRVSLFDALAEWMSMPAYLTLYGGQQPSRSGMRNSTIAPYGPFRCGDGNEIMLAVQNEREWRRLCEQVLHRPELIDAARFRTNAQRSRHTPALQAIIEEALRPLNADAALALLESAGIAYAHVNDVQGLLQHPQLAERDRWMHVPSAAGPLQAIAPAIALVDESPAVGPVPALGEHTRPILRALGYAEAELNDLAEKQVIIAASHKASC